MRKNKSKQYVPSPVSILEDEMDAYIPDFERIHTLNLRGGACEDDYEVSAPFVDILPEESEHQDGSPLSF